MLIRLKNLRLRTIIGVNDWERERPQDVVINLELEFDGSEAGRSDRIEDTVNYKSMKKRLIEAVEASRFELLEALATRLMDLVFEEPRIQRATVEVDKPRALRYVDSVSVVLEREREP